MHPPLRRLLRRTRPTLATTLIGALLAGAALPATDSVDTRRGEHAETLHGIRVADPYRWLEDTASSEVGDWVARQNQQARRHLGALPQHEAFVEGLTALWDYERRSLPGLSASGAQVFEVNSGLQEQPVLHFRAAPEAEARVLLDPNAIDAEEPLSVADYALSPDGELLAYALSRSGSDWRTIRVRRTAGGEDLPVTIRRVKFSDIAWSADSAGFFYSRYPEAPDTADESFDPLAHQQLRFHAIGSDPAKDPVVRADPEHPRRGFSAEVSDDGAWLFLYDWEGTRHNRLHVQRLYRDARARLSGETVPVVRELRADFEVVGNHGDTLYVLSNDAARGRIFAVDPGAPQDWRPVIPEGEDVLRDARLVGGKLVVHALRDAASVLRVHDRHGKLLREIKLPGLGTITGIRGRAESSRLYYGFTSPTQPTRLYGLDLHSDAEADLLHAPAVAFAAEAYVTHRGFASSRDGSRIPVLVTHRRNIEHDSDNSTVLYGYGGFNIALTPRFSVPAAAWLQAGGVWAIANLRGGGEYGRAWHEAGIRTNKTNTFDDVIAAAAWLKNEGYSKPARMALHGASNGGMVVGAVLNRRPDLFAAAVPAVGVMDLLRFHEFTIGWAWMPDYGDPGDAEDFETLHAISPYHNIRPDTAYPATLITTADHDDRVAPGHSYKYAARLQRAQASDAPVLLRVQTQSGHGTGKGTSQRIAEWSDILAFIAEHTGLELTENEVADDAR
ncbi:prolyl oligopeptidase family serine peptidase [Algiphilus aromaticivorans]|uniref:prolyl oligopeptidase family serine peptidase n=1 Tax=Algiphilus aromaticivorans TaxID=382454 RepID=UPI0006939CBC|nr:prolyl oligopeptidase family serine peptidase [Algiphilus aromaticivorans]